MPLPQPLIAALDILIVDDNASMRALLTRVLSAAGASDIRTACDGREALEQLAARPARLILLDQSMPGMSGLELAQHVRANAEAPGATARIVMLSGHADAAHLAAARAAGADEVLVKPVSPRVLLERIAAVFAA